MMRGKWLVTLLLVAACNFSLERQGGEDFLMQFHPLAAAPREKPARGALTVYLPTADASLDSRRIGLVRADGAFDYYAGARWPDFLPVLMRDTLAQTLSHQRLTEQTLTDDDPSPGPYRLRVSIEEFQAIYGAASTPPVVQVHLVATLTDERRAHASYSFDIFARSPAAQDEMVAIQSAFHTAFDVAQRDLMQKLAGVIK